MKWINKFLDVPKLIRRVWVILWITLFIFVIAKLCFNWWYPIVVENEIVVNVCNWIDTTKILKYCIMFCFYILNVNIWYLMSCKLKKYKSKLHFIIFNLLFITGFILKYFNNTLGGIFEFLYLIILPTIYNIKYKTFNRLFINIIYAIGVYLLISLWQLNIFFIRDINKILSDMPTLIQYVLQIDYYIFTIISWIGVSHMGLLGGGFLWGKSETELLALKETELKKENPDSKLIADIDKELERRKNATKA